MHCLITNKSVIRMTGEDSQKFLQSQLTANIEQLDSGASTLACQCSAKGKTWAIMQVIAQNDGYLLVMDQGCAENSLAELKKYSVFSKVDIDDVSAEYTLLGVASNALPAAITAVLAEHNTQAPEGHLQSTCIDNDAILTHYAVPGATPRWTLLAPSSHALIAALKALPEMPHAQWEVMDIQAGIPKLAQAQSEEYVPQMMNMQALDAISFTKGCYMGQEVVARTKYLGKNKRAGAILMYPAGVEINAGDTFELQLGENWRRIGTCLYGATHDQKTWAFAVLPNDLEKDAVIRLQTQPDAHFALQTLPYELD